MQAARGHALCILLLCGSLAPEDGYTFLARGKPTYARTAFRNQLRREPGNVDAMVGLGLAELALGNPEAAVEHLLEAVERHPEHAAARRALAETLLARAQNRLATGQSDQVTRFLLLDAANQAERSFRLAPEDPAPWSVVVRAYLELADVGRAEYALREAVKHGLDPSEERRLRAELVTERALRDPAGRQGEAFLKAEEVLETLLAEDTASPVVPRRLAALYESAGMYEQALAAYEESLRRSPYQRPSLEVLLTYLAVPEYLTATAALLKENAERAVKGVARSDPRPAFPLYCVGQALLLEREYSPSTKHFRDALARDPALALPCWLGIGESSFRDGRYDDAEGAYLQAIRKSPQETLARIDHLRLHQAVAASLIFLSDRAHESKRPEVARDLLSISVIYSPDDAALWNNYAFLCRETGSYEESHDAYQHVLERAPGHPRYLNDAALVLHYHLRRDLDRARSLYERAIQEAERILADEEALEETREMARAALKDATENLGRLTGADGSG